MTVGVRAWIGLHGVSSLSLPGTEVALAPLDGGFAIRLEEQKGGGHLPTGCLIRSLIQQSLRFPYPEPSSRIACSLKVTPERGAVKTAMGGGWVSQPRVPATPVQSSTSFQDSCHQVYLALPPVSPSTGTPKLSLVIVTLSDTLPPFFFLSRFTSGLDMFYSCTYISFFLSRECKTPGSCGAGMYSLVNEMHLLRSLRFLD
ncbi:OAS2 [Cervus elaphus hippelaphus]|uniref:OAS2 n=1 Tax=Cervus elaphus hippelaphus TaxID=46360 RepID=A0A212DAR2_CEREH|nr:OAS2 [Cervus elaphus hippelaphus]